MDINEFIKYCNQDLLPTDTNYLDEAKTKPFIGIDVIRKKLDGLMQFGIYWSTNNFTYTHNNTTEIVTASITLDLGFKNLVGGANANRLELLTNGFDNFVGTVKSMAITNAARDLGRFFGSELYAKSNTETDHEGVKIEQSDFGTKEYNKFKEVLLSCNKKLAQSMLDESEYKDVMELRLLVKKLK